MSVELKTEHPYIIRNPEICGGSPIISGTRITVRLIAGLVKSGNSAEDILLGYPHLTFAQIHDAISYYFDHKEEIVEQQQTILKAREEAARKKAEDEKQKKIVEREKLKQMREEDREKHIQALERQRFEEEN